MANSRSLQVVRENGEKAIPSTGCPPSPAVLPREKEAAACATVPNELAMLITEDPSGFPYTESHSHYQL